MGNDIEITVRVSNQTAGGITSVSTSLHTLRQRSESAARSMRDLAKDTSAAERALTRLRAVAADIRITARIDDQTGEGAAAVKTAVRDLKRLGPIRITATFNGPAAELSAAAAAMRDLRSNSRSSAQSLTALAARAMAAATALTVLEQRTEAASRALRTLRGRAAAAAAAMNDLRDRAAAVSTALRTLNTRAQTTDGRLSGLSDRTRTLRSDMDDLDGSLRRVVPSMNGLRGSLGTLRTSSGNAHGGMQRLKMAAIALAPALIPVGAVAAHVGSQLVAGLGAGAVAVAAFGAALIPQILAMSKIGEAQKTYTKAVDEHGKSSKEAAKAEAAWLKVVNNASPAVREAAASLSVMKGQYKEWAKSLEGDTLGVATKSFAVLGGLFPRLTPVVRAATVELDRFMTIAGGSVASSGFKRMMDQFAEFAQGSLQKANNGLVHMMRLLSQGGLSSGGLSEFIKYAKENGPLVGQALKGIGDAFAKLISAASDVGVSLLTVISAMAKMVASLPTSLITTLLQFAIAMKAVTLAAAGGRAIAGIYAAVRVQMLAMGTAAIGASGALMTLRVAFAALSTAAKTGVVVAGIALLVLALKKISDAGRATPPDVDRLTTSLGKLAQTGRISGEAARVLGKDLGGLSKALATLTDPSIGEGIEKWLSEFTGIDTNNIKDAKAPIEGIDNALAGMVKGGNPALAAAALDELGRIAKKNGIDMGELTPMLDSYDSALADLAFENKLVADSMGLFGAQAQATQQKLSAQKLATDGLRQSLHALNEATLVARGGIRGMEAAIDAASAAFKKNGKTLDDNSEKGRGNNQALDDLASSTMRAAEAVHENTGSWAASNRVLDRGRAKLIEVATQMTGNRDAAKRLADQILRTPDKTARLKGNMEDLQAKLNNAKGQLKKVPDSRKARVRADIADLQRKIAQARYELSRLQDRSVTITTRHVVVGDGSAARRAGSAGSQLKYAEGGPIEGGSGVRDDVPLLAMGGEYIVNKESTRKHRSLLEAINEDRLPKFAKGGRVSKRQKAAQARAKSEREARNDAWSDLTVSHFGRKAGYQRSEFGTALGKPDSLGSLVDALNQWRGIIKKSTHGGQERSLLRQLDSVGKSLIKHEKQLTKVTAELDKAKSKLSDLKSAAASLASSVKSGILGSANITKGAGGEGRVTTASIMGGLIGSRDKASAFAQALKDLQKKGLSKDLLAQVAEAGIDGGGLETASALLGASGSEIKSMNDLQAQIAKAATAAGKVTADAMYGAQIKAQQKLVTALKSHQTSLTKSMDRLTKAMEKAIERAFGGKASGGIIGAASGGARGGMTWVGEQGKELVRLPFGSRVYPAGQSERMWDSMLTEPKRPAVRTPRGAHDGGRPEPVVIELRSSGSDIDEFLLKVLRKAIRVRGGNAQVVLGRAGA